MISQLLQVPKFEVKIPKFIFGKDLGIFLDVFGKTNLWCVQPAVT